MKTYKIELYTGTIKYASGNDIYEALQELGYGDPNLALMNIVVTYEEVLSSQKEWERFEAQQTLIS